MNGEPSSRSVAQQRPRLVLEGAALPGHEGVVGQQLLKPGVRQRDVKHHRRRVRRLVDGAALDAEAALGRVGELEATKLVV